MDCSQAPLSMGFSRQEYWSGLPGPPPGDLPDPGIQAVCLMSPALAWPFSRGSPQPRDWAPVSHIEGGFFTGWATRDAPCIGGWFLYHEHHLGNPRPFSKSSFPHPSLLPPPKRQRSATLYCPGQDPARKMALLVRYKLRKWMDLIQRILYIGVNRLKEQKVRCSTLREDEEEM